MNNPNLGINVIAIEVLRSKAVLALVIVVDVTILINKARELFPSKEAYTNVEKQQYGIDGIKNHRPSFKK